MAVGVPFLSVDDSLGPLASEVMDPAGRTSNLVVVPADEVALLICAL